MTPAIRSGPLLHRGLLAFAGGTVEAKGSDELPASLIVAPWGCHETSKGRVVINDTTAKELPANHAKWNFDRVALDFNHNTVPGSDSYHGEPAKIAAMGTPEVIPGKGVVLKDLAWTNEGHEFFSGNHYGDLSPTLLFNPKNEAIFIHSAALCRQGAIPGLTAFAANPIAEKAAVTDVQARVIVCALLGLPTDAPSEEIISALRDQLGADTVATGNQATEAMLLTVLSAQRDISPGTMQLLGAVLSPQSRDRLVETVVLQRMGLNAEQIRKAQSA